MTDWQYLAASTEAELDVTRNKLYKLEKFYREICKLTVTHDVIVSTNGSEYASVSPQKIAEQLAQIDPDWISKININETFA